MKKNLWMKDAAIVFAVSVFIYLVVAYFIPLFPFKQKNEKSIDYYMKDKGATVASMESTKSECKGCGNHK